MSEGLSGNGEDIFVGEVRVAILFKVFEFSATCSEEMKMLECLGFCLAEELVIVESNGQVANYLSLG